MRTPSGRASDRVLMLMAVVGLLVGGALLALGLTGMSRAGELQVSSLSGDPVAVGADGMSLWSTDAEAYRTAVCTADEQLLLRPVGPYSIRAGGITYHEVARTPAALATGSYAVSCEPAQSLYAGPSAEETSSTGLDGSLGVLLGGALLGLGLLTALVALVARRRRRAAESWRVAPRRLDPGMPGRPYPGAEVETTAQVGPGSPEPDDWR